MSEVDIRSELASQGVSDAQRVSSKEDVKFVPTNTLFLTFCLPPNALNKKKSKNMMCSWLTEYIFENGKNICVPPFVPKHWIELISGVAVKDLGMAVVEIGGGQNILLLQNFSAECTMLANVFSYLITYRKPSLVTCSTPLTSKS